MMVNGFGRGRTVLVPSAPQAGMRQAGMSWKKTGRRVLDNPEQKRYEPGNDGKASYRSVVEP
jgi:hypothetical protein